MLGSRLANLPEGVELQRGELRIGFSGSADFLKKFGAVVFALQTISSGSRNFWMGRRASDARRRNLSQFCTCGRGGAILY
jgi:hypothetical protein